MYYNAVVKRPKLHINLPKRLFMLNCLTRRGPPAVTRRIGPFPLIGVLLALVNGDCQVVDGGDPDVTLLTP